MAGERAKYLLVGDIGGTNSRLAIYNETDKEAIFVKHYPNQKYLENLTEPGIFESSIVKPFLEEVQSTKIPDLDKSLLVACLACAGPVRKNTVTMTNIGFDYEPLVIDGTRIMADGRGLLGNIVRCTIINDFVAQGYGMLVVDKEDVLELTPGSWKMVDEEGPKACVGAGTGLGECYLTPHGDGEFMCYASEGGHVEFCPRSGLEVELWDYLKKKFDGTHRISVERVVSGRGLANVYEFLAMRFPEKIVETVHEEFLKAGDLQGKVVAVNATEGSLCEHAMHIMISAYGSEVGAASLKWLPTGGMFVTGGLTPKNIKYIQGADSDFMKAFHDKGRVSPLLKTIPLFAVMVEDIGVRGAHYCAQKELRLWKKDVESM